MTAFLIFNHLTLIFVTYNFLVLVRSLSVYPVRPNEETCEDFHDLNTCYNSETSPPLTPRPYFGSKTPYRIGQTLLRSKFPSSPLTLDPTFQPILLYMINRHSIPYPKANELVAFREKLPPLRNHLLSGHSQLCPQDLEPLKTWNLTYTEEMSRTLAPAGIGETRDLAKSLQASFPQLLDPNSSKFDVAYSVRTRTEQTAIAFLEGILDLSSIPNRNDSSLGLRLDDDLVGYQRRCEELYHLAGGLNPYLPPEALTKFRESPLFAQALKVMNHRLGLDHQGQGHNHPPLNYNDLTNLLFLICQYETGIEGKSPWCPLIPPSVSKVMEFDSDLGDVLLFAQGPIWKGSSCVLFNDLLRKVQEALSTSDSDEVRSTYLRFTHSTAFKGLVGALDVFRERDPGQGGSNWDRGYCDNEDRAWRSSWAIPYDANIVFVLFRSIELDQVKVLTLVQETPFLVGKCKALQCNLEEFMDSIQELSSDCDLERICRPSGNIPDRSRSSARVKSHTLIVFCVFIIVLALSLNVF